MQQAAFLLVAVLVIGFLGAFILIYPNDPKALLALGTLTTVAGAVGTALFHQSSQTFLGDQLGAQRALTVAALKTGTNGSGTPSTASTISSTPPSTTGTPTPPSS